MYLFTHPLDQSAVNPCACEGLIVFMGPVGSVAGLRPVESHHAQSAALHVRPVDAALQVDDAALVWAQPGRAHRPAARGKLLCRRTHSTDQRVTNEDAATA